MMLSDPRVLELLEELLESDLAPEDVCLNSPELLAAGPRALAAPAYLRRPT